MCACMNADGRRGEREQEKNKVNSGAIVLSGLQNKFSWEKWRWEHTPQTTSLLGLG